MRVPRPASVVITLSAGLLLAVAARAQRADSFSASMDHPAIRYTTAPVETAITRLNRAVADGSRALTFDPRAGYLPSLLAALDIPPSSQQLVFSESSAQAAFITPTNPRAVYFNEQVAVGWVRGAPVLEIAAHAATQGTVFYTLGQQRQDRPAATRDQTCLRCHLTWDTRGVPGWTLLSTFPMSDDPRAYASGVVMDHGTPLHQRWGGWYVTGRRVPGDHYGNLPVIRRAHDLATPPPTPAYETVATVFDTAGFPVASSDVVAALVLAHQSHGLNLLTRLGWEQRAAERDGTLTRADVAARLGAAVDELVDYLLFVDEATLPQPIAGAPEFTAWFTARGPRDGRGRSLHELDLTDRLLRHRCSYLVYSPAFEALPPAALAAVYQRLWAVLSGTTPRHADPLPRDERQAIVEILRDTRPGLPAYFGTPVS